MTLRSCLLPGYEALEGNREQASTQLGLVNGIYRPAQELFEESEEWEKQVSPPLQKSKAVRTLVIPLLLASICVTFSSFCSARLGLPLQRIFGFLFGWGLGGLLGPFEHDLELAKDKLQFLAHPDVAWSLLALATYLYFK